LVRKTLENELVSTTRMVTQGTKPYPAFALAWRRARRIFA
jgi:hypothetical protein